MEKIQDSFKIKGEMILTKRKVPKWVIPFERLGLYDFVKRMSPIIYQKRYTNLVCTVGKDTIVNRWCGTVTKTGTITYIALGTGTDVPAIGDTALQTEVYRKLLTTRTKNATTCETSTYIPTNEGNYTYKEVGLYGDDASGVADSGTLYTHAVVDETKTDGTSVTLDYNLIIA